MIYLTRRWDQHVVNNRSLFYKVFCVQVESPPSVHVGDRARRGTRVSLQDKGPAECRRTATTKLHGAASAMPSMKIMKDQLIPGKRWLIQVHHGTSAGIPSVQSIGKWVASSFPDRKPATQPSSNWTDSILVISALTGRSCCRSMLMQLQLTA